MGCVYYDDSCAGRDKCLSPVNIEWPNCSANHKPALTIPCGIREFLPGHNILRSYKPDKFSVFIDQWKLLYPVPVKYIYCFIYVNIILCTDDILHHYILDLHAVFSEFKVPLCDYTDKLVIFYDRESSYVVRFHQCSCDFNCGFRRYSMNVSYYYRLLPFHLFDHIDFRFHGLVPVYYTDCAVTGHGN